MFAKNYILVTFLQITIAFNLPENQNMKEYGMCYKQVIDQYFEKSDPIYVISDDMNDTVPFEISRQKVIINPNLPQQFIQKQNLYTKNFVIRARDNNSLQNLLIYLNKVEHFFRFRTNSRKFLIITMKNEIKATFRVLWHLGIHNAVVLVIEDSQEMKQLTWYWSNPFTTANGCGSVPNVIGEQLCNDSSKFPVKVGSLGVLNCPVHFATLNPKKFEERDAVSFNVFQILTNVHHMHVKVVANSIHPPKRSNRHLHINDNSFVRRDWNSQEFNIQRFVYILPLPDRISFLRIFLIIFQTEVWIMVIAGFCTSLLLYLGVLAYYRLPINFFAFSIINFQIYSLTIWGSFANFPKIRALRLFLLCYIFYAIVIQTAYVSGLIRVITIPQYEKGINDLNDLTESSIPIYIKAGHYKYFGKFRHYNELVSKLEKKVVEFHPALIKNLREDFFKYNNISVLLPENDAVNFLNVSVENKLILDSSLIGFFANIYYMDLPPDVQFINKLDKSITLLKETGIYSKLHEDRVQLAKKVLVPFSHSSEPQVLTFHHVYGIFVIFGFGICISCVVFILEIIVSKSRRRGTRRIHVLPALKENVGISSN